VGLESTPEAYIEHLVQIFREVRRVLRSDGVVALNLGDSYWGGKGKSGYELPHEAEGRRAKGETFQTGHNVPGYMDMRPTDGKHPTIKPLDLCLTPFRVILALQADGWYIRSVLPWIKRSCMPESINGWRWEQHRVKVGNEGRDQARRGQGTSEVQFQNHSGNTVYSDAKWQDCPGCPTCAPNGGLVLRRGSGRPTTAHEYIFLLTKSSAYFWDSEATKSQAVMRPQARLTPRDFTNGKDAERAAHRRPDYHLRAAVAQEYSSRNARTSDWFFDSLRAILDGENAMLCDEGGEPLAMVVNPHGWPEAHFATYPERLVEPLIKAATSKGGNCPRCGAPWARVVERQSLTEREIGRRPNTYHCKEVADRGDLGQCAKYALTNTLGWRPTCACGAGLEPDDLEFIFTPTGHRIAADPSLVTGRAGYNRPRGADEGSRPITRYEQRRYAEQLRNSPHRAEMEQEAGSAFAHYIRTDKSGARPIPPDLLEAWIERGWLVRVALPEQKPLEPIPAVVLDPFVGSGTTCLVAKKLGRRFVGIDLSEEYVQMARRRVGTVLL
jgi:hypothetical protein